MNIETGPDIRAAIHALAAEGRPVDLSVPALRLGRRRIRRRRAGLAGLAVAAALVAIAVPYALVASHRAARHVPAAPPTSASPSAASISPGRLGPVPSSGPVRLPGGLIVLAIRKTAAAPARVYDRAKRRYVAVAETFDPAPRGSLVMENSADNQATSVRDLTTGRSYPLSIPAWVGGEFPGAWSPDGRYLAAHTIKGNRVERIEIVDASRGTSVHSFPIDWTAYRCGDYCQLSWSPDGTQVGVTVTDETVPHDESIPDVQRGVQFFSVANGAPARLVPVPGWIPGAYSWSPDNRYLVIWGRTDKGARATQIVTADGKLVTTISAGAGSPGMVNPERIRWSDDGRLVVAGGGEHVNELLYLDVSGMITTRVALPADLPAGALELGRE